MKQLKLALLAFAFMGAMISGCSSCEKDKVEPDNSGNNNGNNNGNVSADVTATDLLNYYVLLETSNNNFRVLYFTSEGGKVRAYMDGLGIRRSMEVGTLTGEKLDFEFNTGIFYHFTFDKSSDNNVVLKSCSLSGNPATVTNAQLDKVASAPVFYKEPGGIGVIMYDYTKTETYCASVDYPVSLWFDYGSGPIWQWNLNCGHSEFMGYYFIGNKIGWKSNDESTFGVVMNNWKGTGKKTMVLISTIEALQDGVIHNAFEF